MWEKHCLVCGPFVLVIYGKDMLKSSIVLFCSNLNVELFDLVMGEPSNPSLISGDTRTLQQIRENIYC